MPPRRRSADLEIRVAACEEDLAAHHRVRHAVFVEEQAVFPGGDLDAWDPTAVHVVAALGPVVVGAVRLYALDEAGLWQGDRLAVLPEARRLGVGAPLVRFAVATAGTLGGSRMIARVQEPNVPFFLHLGWSRIGPPETYRDLPHQRMMIPLSGAAGEFAPSGYAWALG